MSFNLDQMDPSGKSKTSMPVNIGAHLLSSTTRQTPQVDLLPRFHSPIPVSMLPPQLPLSQGMFQPSLAVNNPYQLAFSSKQSTPMSLSNLPSPANVYMDFEKAFPLVKESSLGAQNAVPVLNSKKRPLQRDGPMKFHHTMLINQGPQLLPLMSKRPSQTEPPPKAQQESFESVRSKLRESLAASLIVEPDQPSKQELVQKTSPNEPASIVGKEEVGKESVEMGSSKLDFPGDAGHNGITADQAEVLKTDVQEDQSKLASLENEVTFSSNSIINDELLQGHGLCWASDVNGESTDIVMDQALKKPKLLQEEVTEKPETLPEKVTDDSKEKAQQKAETLAVKIEAELFKLFGGVNKKYKEKARSLLFNLKDRSNPELRERVLSGDIVPERLCSMTAEELASKELSEWRLAKAEELAHMVVLQDSEVDIRRLVKKTHKGEFQVEVEQDDAVSVEVAVGESISSHFPAKANGAKTKTKSDKSESKASEELISPDEADSGDQNESGNLDALLNEKTDLMQDLMVEELKDTEFLPPIVSLDEFMQALDSEPPFDNLSMSPDLSEKNSDGLHPEMGPESDSLELKSADPALGDLSSKLDSPEDISKSKLSPPKTDYEEIVKDDSSKKDTLTAMPGSDLKPGSSHVEPDASLMDIRSRSGNIWEGLLQLNVSALATVMGYFRSGEKTSTQDWPNFLEIKGRVRLDAFEKFLQELRLSRSRALMIAQFCWKEGTPESGRLSICETVNSYIADQRVGFAEPSPGMEIYFCPPHPKTTEILERHLPKDHTETLGSTTNGLIGVVVWRRPHVNTISPRFSSHHKHGTSTKKHSSSRRHHQNVAVNPNPSPTLSTHSKQKPPPDDDDGDVPPGFGPGSATARDEDDLPEFDFVNGAGAANPHSRSHLQPPTRPVDQMRELIFKYGKGEGAKNSTSGVRIKPWNDEDDIPEWQPNQNSQPQHLPPPPPQPQPQPQQQPINFQQQAMQPQFVVHPNLAQTPGPTHQQMQYMQGPPQQLVTMVGPTPIPLQPQQFHPQMAVMQGQGQWHQGVPFWPSDQGQVSANVGVNMPVNGMMQPCQFGGGGAGGDGQIYGVQNGMGWRPDVPRNRGV